MVSFPHVVQAPPERVFDTLVSPTARMRHQRFYKVAESEKGRAGETGLVARFETRLLGKWREALEATERPTRVVFEELAAAKEGTPIARLEWRLAPIQLGTHVVLEVKGSNLWAAFVCRFVKRYRYRAVVRALKKSVEGEPESIVPEFPTIEEWRRRRGEAAEAPEEKAPRKSAPANDAAEAPAGAPSTPRKLQTIRKGEAAAAEEKPTAARAKPKKLAGRKKA